MEKEIKKNKGDYKETYYLLLLILCANDDYLKLFSNITVNAIVNIILGIITICILFVIFAHRKEILEKKDNFFVFLFMILNIIGLGNSFYNVGYGIGQILSALK